MAEHPPHRTRCTAKTTGHRWPFSFPGFVHLFDWLVGLPGVFRQRGRIWSNHAKL